jgi:murein L,D-transpeptidase YcbB/YkuD
MRDTRILALRARLAASGDSTSQPTAEPEQFDEALEAALKNFQMRHGLEADGAVGARTLQALNVDVAARIEQIRVDLERLRWVAQDLGGDYLLVDIAGFSARLHLDGALAWSSRVVVGRPYRKTPAFRATMRSIVLNPAWTVPPTILREDVLPEIIKDRGYLERHNMHVIDKAGGPVDPAAIDWGQYRSRPFPYRIVEEPGPANPLGALKFEFPNRYGVYLHDSPAKALFERTERAFSSGCIRLEAPHSLAVLLLDDAGQWGMDALRAAIESRATRTLPVKRRVPVMALYLTAEASDDGRVAFRVDLYGADAKVSVALAAPFRFRPVDRPRTGGTSR